MKNSLHVLIALFCASAVCAEEPFVKSEIVPDVISSAPTSLLKVEYKKNNKKVAVGNELQPKDVREPPTVTYAGNPEEFYTVIMTDPDAPSRKNPIRREWNHWLVVNIPGSDISKGEVLTEYVGSGPPKDTGLHRYVFLLYKQPNKLKFDEEYKSKTNGNRGKFSAENFAKKYKLGVPIAGNFFQAQFDDSVPALHKQFA